MSQNHISSIISTAQSRVIAIVYGILLFLTFVPTPYIMPIFIINTHAQYSKGGIFTELALPIIHLKMHNNCSALLSEMVTNDLNPLCTILKHQGHRPPLVP